MERIVLLAVAAAWAAVLLPPLLRSRSENRPGSSVSDFSRQLSSLQRSVPTRGMAPMRSIARPLTNARPGAPTRLAGHANARSLSIAGREPVGAGPLRRTHHEPTPRSHGEVRLDRDLREQRPAAPQREYRSHHEPGHRQAQVRRAGNARAEIRRRRTNVLFMLTAAFVGSLFLAATTKSDVMMYALALTFLSLCAYCYRLVQLREIERGSTNQHDNTGWYRAA